MYKISSTLTFLLIFVCYFPVSAQDEARASVTWQVQKYDISATLPQGVDRNLTAKAVLNLKNVSSGSASRLTLRIAEKAEVTDVKVNGSAADFSKGLEKIDSVRNLQRAIVRLPSIAPDGTVSVEVNYKLRVDENSGLGAISPVGSQFLPLSFWYPTPNSWFFVRGADYAPFTLKINSPNNMTILSSGRENGGSFDQSLYDQPFFIAGRWDKLDAGSVTIYMPKGAGANEQQRAQELAKLASDARDYTSSLLGSLPETPLRLISAKRGAGFSGGGTILIDDSVFRRQKIDSQTALTIAESIAKIWLGNSAAVSGEGYGAVREGLSRYVATQFIEQKFGKDVADVERLKQRTAYASIARRDAPLSLVSPIDDFYYAATANKGSMIWRLLAKKIGNDEFFRLIKQTAEDRSISLSEIRSKLSSQSELLNYAFDQVTDVNLLVGLPQTTGGETKVALRNTGSIDVTVDVVAALANGEKTSTTVTLRPKSFGEVNFKTGAKINYIEIDSEKLYPQTEYTDDVAPREFDNSDLLLVVKRDFDRQDFVTAEKKAKLVLSDFPRFDDVRILLGRSYLAQNKLSEAEKEFRAVLNEKLPSARSLAWANVGLGDVYAKNGKTVEAAKHYNEAIRADAEYGATLAAQNGRNKFAGSESVNSSIIDFFSRFDKAAISNQKAQLDDLIVAGEITKFAGAITGQAQQWNTKVLNVDQIDENTFLVETSVNLKLLNRSPESGRAVYRLVKVENNLKLNSVDIFEVK